MALPYYASLGRPLTALVAMARSVSALWSVLPGVDSVWVLGPHPLATLFAALAAARGRTVALGVRQDFPSYVRARNPNRRWMHLTADLLETAWRLLARWVPVVAVGPALAARYRRGRTLELAVSLVPETDVGGTELDTRRDYTAPELRLLSVGRLEQEKNPVMLADVLARLRERSPRWRLLVCGEGPLQSALEARASELGVSEYLELVGYVPHDKLRDIYLSSHVLLHVSFTEGVPQVLFEAFAARLPVVATAVGGVAAAVDGAATLIEPGNPAAAADAVEEVAAQNGLRTRLVAAGTRLAAGHTLDAEARRMARFLDGG